MYHSLKAENKTIGGVFGFVNVVLNMNKVYHPISSHFCFDDGSWRYELHADYKKDRPEKDAEYVEQLATLYQLLKDSGCSVYKQNGLEADDIIASIHHQNPSAQRIISKDKDLLQLVDYYTLQVRGKWLSRKPDEWDLAKVYKQFGVTVNQLTDYMSLVGDKVDYIPGVYMIGPVTAKKLIHEYGTIGNIYNNLDSLSTLDAMYLKAGKGDAFLSETLIDLRTPRVKVPVQAGICDIYILQSNANKLRIQ